MIQLHYENGHYTPIFVCDICEQRIADAKDAISRPTTGHVDPIDVFDLIHVHKGKCDRTAEARYGINGCEELTDHILWLAGNCRVTPEDLV